MPVATLLVEGALDQQLLSAVIHADGLGGAVVERAGSKGSLAPRVAEYRKKGIEAFYLRDRDFDHDPDPDGRGPTVDRVVAGRVVGWRWCRHAVESYLLDPGLVERALQLPRADFERALLDAAGQLQAYQVGRWAMARVRADRSSDPRLHTRPPEIRKSEMALPRRLDAASIRAWVDEEVGAFRDAVLQSTETAALDGLFVSLTSRQQGIATPKDVLLLCSGKDILAALEPWFLERKFGDRGQVRERLRNFVLDHPSEALALLPEWRALVTLLQA